MISSIYRIAEQCRQTLPNVEMQPLIAAVQDCFGTVAKGSWYENKQDGVSEVDGSLIFTFGKTNALSPAVDVNVDMYYIVIPSSAVALPNGYGINMVSFMKAQNTPLIMINSGSVGMWANVKAGILGGRQTYFVEGTKMYFPKMTSATVQNILLKMVLALGEVDVREELNIPPDMISQIVLMVNQKFLGSPAQKS